MKRIFRILVLAVALVTGLTTVSAQTVQVFLIQRIPTLPATVISYLDDPFRYFNVQFVVTDAGSEGLDIFFDMDFTVNTSPFYVRTRQGTVPMIPIHLSEGVNIMKSDVLQTQVVNRVETNVDYSSPVNAQQLPEGTYTLCVDIYRWSDREDPNRVPISVPPCPTFDICYSGSAPELVAPMAGTQMALNGAMVVTPNRKVNFFWTPVISNCSGRNNRFKYKLKVVKVLEGQNYQDAIKFNPTVFSTEVRNETFAVFDTLRDIKVQMEKGALYVAQVQAEQLSMRSSGDAFVIANDGNSQPLPFFWDYPNKTWSETNIDIKDIYSRTYGYVVEDESEEGEISEGIAGLTLWEGGVEEVSELETIANEMQEQRIVSLTPNRHYVESDGYYTIPMTDDIEVSYKPAQHKSFKNISHEIALYDYIDGGIDSITAYEPLFSERITDKSQNRTLAGWGTELKQGNLYYMQLSSFFTVGYWNYSIADTSFYVNEMLAEHIHDTISRAFVEDEMMTSNGVFFQWGDDPAAPAFTAPQWKAPVDRTGDDVYDPANYVLPSSIPEIQKAKSFPVSWTPFKNVKKGDKAEYEVNVYELKPDQTLEEAVLVNKALVSRTVTNANAISDNDADFFKVFSPKKTYVMTLSTIVSGDNTYHFKNGNEAIPVVFKIVK